MRKPVALTIILLVLVTSACSPILKIVYGVKKPTPTSNTEVSQYSNDLFGDGYVQFRPVNDTAYASLVNEHKIAFPGIIFFDKEGRGISMHKDTLESCSANAESFIAQLKNLNTFPKLKVTIQDIDALIQKTNTPHSDGSLSAVNPEYSIRIFWANFAGDKLNKSKSKRWVDTYASLPDDFKKKVDLRLINMDSLLE